MLVSGSALWQQTRLMTLRGRPMAVAVVDMLGPVSSGKTTLIYHITAEAQKLGGVCASDRA
jgi:RecA/RadA recombinase